MSDVLNFSVTNTTNGTIPISFLGNAANPNDNSNANTQYFWDVTGFTIAFESSIIVQYKTPSQTSFTSAIVPLSGNTIQDVVNALNTLNLGVFFITTSGGNTYINNYNTEYEFNGLSIYQPSVIDPTFIIGSGFDVSTFSIATQSDGKILVGGFFSNYNGTPANYIIRLNSDGSVDPTFVYGIGFDNFVTGVAIQSDGKILLGGDFTNYNGTPANRIIRLNTDGSVDPTFVYGTGFNGSNIEIVLQPDGKILISGGFFTDYNGTPANYIIRLNTDGSVDGTFVYGTSFDNFVRAIAIQSDGKILLGGDFTNYNGTPANGIIRLNSDGSVDGTFVYGTGFNNNLNSIAIQSDGKILAGGFFTNYNGTPANRIIRLNSDGSVDGTFVYGTGFDNSCWSIATQSDGKILVGGDFTNYDGTPTNRFIRLNLDGSVDSQYNTALGLGFNSTVQPIFIQSDTKILAGGNFTTVLGESYNRIVRLLPIAP